MRAFIRVTRASLFSDPLQILGRTSDLAGQSRTLLDCASDRACSGNAGGIGQAGWQGLQWPLRWGSIEGLPQLPLLQLMQQQLGICIPVLLPNRIVGLRAKVKVDHQDVGVQSMGSLPCHQLMLPLH